MSNKQLSLAFVAAFLLVAWLFRYEIIPVTAGQANYGYAYLFDRWTGRVDLLQGSQQSSVQRKQ